MASRLKSSGLLPRYHTGSLSQHHRPTSSAAITSTCATHSPAEDISSQDRETGKRAPYDCRFCCGGELGSDLSITDRAKSRALLLSLSLSQPASPLERQGGDENLDAITPELPRRDLIDRLTAFPLLQASPEAPNDSIPHTLSRPPIVIAWWMPA